LFFPSYTSLFCNFTGALYIRAKNVIAQTYDVNEKPSCYNGRASVQLPGMIKLVSGTLIVTKKFDLEKSGDLRLTVTKDSFFIGTVCKDGVSQTSLVPSSDCHRKIFPGLDKGFVDMISNPGTYDLQEGDWEAQLTLISDGETVADIKAPSNTHWLYVS
uniref:CUB domain-containing protein n=1 Tax=Angiostrongylus cantonensis TaxID=6313 RepID=A0A0K0CUW0_ANGCA